MPLEIVPRNDGIAGFYFRDPSTGKYGRGPNMTRDTLMANIAGGMAPKLPPVIALIDRYNRVLKSIKENFRVKKKYPPPLDPVDAYMEILDAQILARKIKERAERVGIPFERAYEIWKSIPEQPEKTYDTPDWIKTVFRIVGDRLKSERKLAHG